MHGLQSGWCKIQRQTKKTRTEVVEKCCWTQQLNKENAINQSKLRELINILASTMTGSE